jgi:type 1 glutamine amidotransferase
MSRHALWLSLCLLVCISIGGQAQDSKPAAKLKALFISGGGYHDFQKLAPFLTSKMSELSSVQWEVKWDPEVLKDENFSDRFDAIVYDMCFDQIDPMSLENALKATRSGKPTMVIHCAMHSFKASDEWRRLLGMTTRVHDPYQAFGTEKVNADHPVVRGFPDDWKTPGDELYQTISVDKGADVLLTAKSPSTGNVHTVCWTNQYGRGRVFATTLGHDMKTADQLVYHQLLTRGLLWACGKLDKGGRPLPGYAGPGWK